ncbi:carboxypeptidase regulatory-like domain-containing protein [Ruania alba]|uniref:Carboxypeptidase regulatory-like domain-containing protein n=1 Tax=Ruania alba TaxID=648782 RepID=A0A1H5KMJ3_9MICO|nr:carboxypeptidase regulatory-like domain-containing protein [Ruania alba]SEE66076.1 Carboxypeptidase regulatory-like domain-containing protein [Ruania alba]
MNQARRSGPQAPTVSIEPGAHAPAAGVATIRVHARNLAPGTRLLHVAVVGLDEGWLPAPAEVEAAADETITVELAVTPAEGAVPGSYPFLVTIDTTPTNSADGTVERTLTDATLRVDGSSDLVLSVEPADSRGRRRKRIEVVVGNTGATPVEVALTSTADQELTVHLGSGRVELGPAETVRVPARVGPRRTRLVGSRTRHSYEVLATGQAAPRRTQATFTSGALLSAGAMRATAVVAVAAVWLAGVLVALPYVADRFSSDETPTSAENVTVDADSSGDSSGTDSAGGNDDPNANGDAGGVGDSGGAGQEGDEEGSAQSLRISGVITGAAPDDATIEVVPTASLWPSSAAVTAGPQPGAAPGKRIVPAAPTAPVTPSGTAQRLTTFADGNGAWALAGLTAAARYLVTITKPGYSTQRVVMSGAELAATPLETDLQAGDGSMSGTVQGPDGPVGGAEITLTDGTTTITTRSATTGTVGSWQVDGLVTPSTYLVEASSPDLGTEAELIALPASGARTADLTLDAGVASVSGQVAGQNSLGQSSGLGGITVTATDGTTTRTATTLTGEGAGAFLLPRLPVGSTYTMTISGDGYTTVTREVRLTAEGVSGWTIPMTSSGGVVQGAVSDETGTGITAAGLTLTHGSDTTAVYKTMSASDGSGTFRFSGVDAGTYVLSAESFGHETSYAEVIVHPGGSVEVDLTLPALVGDGLVATSSITGRVTDFTTGGSITCPVLTEGEECRVTAEVRAVDIDGQSHLLSTAVAPDADYTLPQDSDTVTGLLPGRYVVTITAPGYEPGEVEVTVPMATEVQAETVALIPSPSLTGSVQARTGLLPEGVCVIARSVAESGAIENPCDAAEPECRTTTSRCALVTDGTYRMDRLAAGRYEVSVTGLPDDYLVPDPKLVTLIAGEVQRHDILVERLGIVSVTASRSDGTSRDRAEGAWIRAVRDGETGAEVVDEERVGETGSVQLTGLAPGTYTIAASEDQGGEVLASAEVTIGLNQEVQIQLVLASNEDTVHASVMYQLEAAKDLPVADASILITGVAAYLNGAAIPGTWLVETDNDGNAVICADPDAGCEHTVPVLENPWTIHVYAPGFEPVTLSNAPLSSLDRVILTQQAQEFTGSVTIAPDTDGVVEGTRFEVLQAPPGVGDLSLQAGPDGSVTFSDTGAPESGQIRPGRYTIRATLDGYASSTVEFNVPLTITGPPPEPTWELLQDARVRVGATDDDTGAQVPGAVMTLRDPDGDLELERTAGPSQRVVDFGTLPAGDYEVDIRIAGYKHLESANITVDPGRTDPIEVPVTRLGTITGEVVTVLEDGWTQDLPGADVTVTSGADDPTFTTSSGEDGGFAVTGTVDLEGLVDGEWNVSADADHHEDADAQVVLDGGVQQQGGEPLNSVTLGLNPAPANLSVTVADGTDLVESLDVVLMLSTPDGFRSITPCQEGTAGCETGDGTFHFVDLLPTSYTLFVSGSGYLPVSTPVTLEAGQPQQLQVPITAPTGSIQGQVLRTLPDGSTHPVDGGDGSLSVALVDDDGDRRYAVSGDGTYLIEGIEAGAYGVVVREQSGGTWTDVAPVRTVSVLAGQSLALDLTIPLTSRPVQLTLNSANGTDLTGALVTLIGTVEGEGEELTFGPQPVTRSGDHTYAVTFQQVPVGTWTATVAGPAGHYGSHVSDEIDVGAGDGPVAASMDIAETELRLQIAPVDGPLTPPSRVTVTASPADTDSTDSTAVETVTTTLITGAGDTVIYLPAVGWNLEPAIEEDSGWEATIDPVSISGGVTNELARVSLVAPEIATTTTLDLSSPEAVIGDEVTATVTMSAEDGGASSGPSTGTVELSWRQASASDWTLLGDTVDLTAGTAVIGIDTSDWTAGDYVLRAVVTPPDGWAASSSTATLALTEDVSGSESDSGTDAAGSGSGADAGPGPDSDSGPAADANADADADPDAGAGDQASADGP